MAKRSTSRGFLAGLLALTGLAADAAGPIPDAEILAKSPGQVVYETHCVGCHGTSESRAPVPAVLRLLAPEQVLASLRDGIMREQAQTLTEQERKDVAAYLTAKPLGVAQQAPGMPPCARHDFDASKGVVSRDWGLDFENTRVQSLEAAGLEPGDLDHLQVAWAITWPNAIQVRSQPTFAGGWLYMGSQDGSVYALDAASGCMHWRYQAASEVRTSVSLGDSATGRELLAVFGDRLGNVYAVEARTGKPRWKVRPDAHPHIQITGSPRIVGERVYVPLSTHEDVSAARATYPCCTARGGVAALEVETGKTVWLSHSVVDAPTPRQRNAAGTQQFGPSGAAVWNSPAIDLARRQLYVGTGDNYSEPATGTSDAVIAMDLDTGAHRWVFQATPGGDIWNTACMVDRRGPNCPAKEGPDFDIGAGVILTRTKAGRPVLLAGQKSGDAFAIDPDSGALVWRRSIGRGGIQGGIHFGMAAADGVGYIPVSDMLYVHDAATHSYTRAPRPGLFAVDLATGNELWAWEPTEDTCRGRDFCDPGIAAPPTILGDRLLVGGLDGVLRLHDRATGRVLWSLDTTRPIQGINGMQGQGGSMNAIGPVAYGGTVYVASGYAFAGHMPGNLLLALRPRRDTRH